MPNADHLHVHRRLHRALQRPPVERPAAERPHVQRLCLDRRPLRRAARAAAGFTLLDLALVLALSGLVLVLGLPALNTWSTALRLEVAAAEIAGALANARSLAIRHSVNAAVKFHVAEDGTVLYAIYRDGDGDGVLTADVERGVDPVLQPARPLAAFDRRVQFGFPPGQRPTDPSQPRRRLGRLEDPIRFNRSDLASFDPLGTATPGTVYLTDGHRHLVAVRVTAMTGRVSIVRYDAETETWR